MNKHTLGRRHFLKTLTAIGAAGLPVASVFGSRLVYAADGAAKTAYDPAAKFELTVSEVEMRRNSAGRMLKARIYQPKGRGAVPSRARSARRRLERQRPHRGGADGPRHREQRRARGCHRYDAGQRRRRTRLAFRMQTTACAG